MQFTKQLYKKKKKKLKAAQEREDLPTACCLELTLVPLVVQGNTLWGGRSKAQTR